MKHARGWAPLLLIVMAAGCWEQTLEERVVVQARPDGGFAVRVETQLNMPGDREHHLSAIQRVEERARQILVGRDLWMEAFSQIGAEEERFAWQKVGGQVYRSEHSAVVEDPKLLEPVLRVCGAGLEISTAGDRWRLEIFPLSSSRANSKDRRDVEQELKPWTEAVADYGRSVASLFSFAKSNADRAPVLFAHVFAEQLSTERREGLPDLSDNEQTLIDEFEENSTRVLGFAMLDPGRSETLNERVMAVFSPLCGEIAVELSSPALNQEGFVQSRGLPTIPPSDLYTALMSGALTPVSPDPLLTLLERSRYHPASDFELDAWLAAPRSQREPPTASDVLRELKFALQPSARYRLEWARPASDEPESSTAAAPG